MPSTPKKTPNQTKQIKQKKTTTKQNNNKTNKQKKPTPTKAKQIQPFLSQKISI